MRATPKRVFEVLADPASYASWVVGSKAVHDADPDWPAPGARFHHTVGFGPVDLKDHTTVLEVKRPRLLKLKARARPLGTAHLTLELSPAGKGTWVTMIENPGDVLSALLFSPLMHLLVRRRNDTSLERLARLAERRAPARERRAA